MGTCSKSGKKAKRRIASEVSENPDGTKYDCDIWTISKK